MISTVNWSVMSLGSQSHNNGVNICIYVSKQQLTNMTAAWACPYLSLETCQASDPQDLAASPWNSVHFLSFFLLVFLHLLLLLAAPRADPLRQDRCWNSGDNLVRGKN